MLLEKASSRDHVLKSDHRKDQTLCWTDTKTGVQLWQRGLAISERTVELLSSGSHADGQASKSREVLGLAQSSTDKKHILKDKHIHLHKCMHRLLMYARQCMSLCNVHVYRWEM